MFHPLVALVQGMDMAGLVVVDSGGLLAARKETVVDSSPLKGS